MKDSIFKKLESLNSQIDIWIDEEDYRQVKKVFQLKKEYDKKLNEAFKHETCTKDNDTAWADILDSSLQYPFIAAQDITGDNLENWSPFFWAKLIRARIQEKGTDCYFRRLDDIVYYLECHLPNVKITDSNNSKLLAVIYLLEMAATGASVDQRSFAERARRTLKTIFKNPQDKSFKFYDLIARYTRGVGYFHDGSFRRAVLEFNYIITELKHTIKTRKYKFYEERKAYDLLYLPSILYRADIQIELQLAYHAWDTLLTSKFPGVNRSIGTYKESRANLIRAEAYQQMSRWDDAWQELTLLADRLGVKLGSYDKNIDITKKPIKDYSIIRSKLQSLRMVQYLSHLKKGKMDDTEFIAYLKKLEHYIKQYKLLILYQEPYRNGFLKEIADLLTWLVKKSENSNTSKKARKEIIKVTQTIFNENKDNLLISSESGHLKCPCEQKNIVLWGLKPEEYKVFYESMLDLLNRVTRLINGIHVKNYRKKFIGNLAKHEKENDNLRWRIRKFDLSIQGKEFNRNHDKWVQDKCTDCLDRPKDDATFDGLLTCAKNRFKPVQLDRLGYLIDEDYETIMGAWDKHFIGHLKASTVHTPYKRSLHFLGLQRWNSTSPAQGRSLGGGYFIYHTEDYGKIDLGIAVDPGFDFVRNLFHAGFSLADIDVVILSHAHVDHVRDFESMISLLLELKKRDGLQLKLHAVMTLGVYKRLEFLIESPGYREFIEPYIVDIEKEINENYPVDLLDFKFYQMINKNILPPPNDRLRFSTKENEVSSLELHIKPILSYHDDHTGYSDTFGFEIHITDKDKNSNISQYSIGYTSDTSWHIDFKKDYVEKNFNVLLVHLGSLIDRNELKRKTFSFYDNCKKCFKLITEKNHPYLMGMLHFLNDLNSDKKKVTPLPLVLISEFGEEMRGGIRLDFYKRIRNSYNNFHVLPMDVGLDIMLAPINNGEPTVRCAKCDDFVPLSKTDFETYGHDEALFCVCKTCLKSTPHNVLQDRLRNLYEVGRELRSFQKDDKIYSK